MVICVLSITGKPLMPMHDIRKARKMEKEGKLHFCCKDPLTVQLNYLTKDEATQPVELCMDTGYEDIGISIKSEKEEYVSEERKLLTNEKEKHDARRKNRRNRRSRKTRYREPKFDNRVHHKKKGWLPPSLKNKADVHVALIEKYMRYYPISSVTIEVGQFDTQVLQAIEKGDPLPEGIDYQHGESYGYDTLRDAVFARDQYKCVVCGASGIPAKGRPGIPLRIHHLGYLQHDRSNRMDNMVTVCCHCHTSANHQEGGKLYGLEPKLNGFKGAAFMNSVKWYIYKKTKKIADDIVHLTYGVVTKRTRNDLGMPKTHANDAYCMGQFRPAIRAKTAYYKKVRRHNRELEKFYDAVYIDSRDGQKRKGAALFNGRTNRNHKTDTENLHKYRQEKVSKGKRAIRTVNTTFRPGDIVRYKGKLYAVNGVKNGGKALQLIRRNETVNPVIKSVKKIRPTNGWCPLYY